MLSCEEVGVAVNQRRQDLGRNGPSRLDHSHKKVNNLRLPVVCLGRMPEITHNQET